MRDIYHEFGQYEFKVVLNPKFYKTGHDFKVEMFDSSNNKMNFKYEVWGRKINITFDVSDKVSDGVSYVDVYRNENKLARLTFWIIKP
jgi:riboflavin synthase alpha subunit